MGISTLYSHLAINPVEPAASQDQFELLASPSTTTSASSQEKLKTHQTYRNQTQQQRRHTNNDNSPKSPPTTNIPSIMPQSPERVWVLALDVILQLYQPASEEWERGAGVLPWRKEVIEIVVDIEDLGIPPIASTE